MLMTSLSDSSAGLLAAASAVARGAARWERFDVETRRPAAESRELLLARAAELALSPIGRDQLLSLALEQGIEATGAVDLLARVPAPAPEREGIAQQVFALAPRRSSESASVVLELEARHVRSLGADGWPDCVPACLRQEALLHEVLWDHPAIPAPADVRLIMLCSVPKLLQRADDLSSSWPLHGLARWMASTFKRSV